MVLAPQLRFATQAALSCPFFAVLGVKLFINKIIKTDKRGVFLIKQFWFLRDKQFQNMIMRMWRFV